jgi:hypothetical protein
MPVSLSRFLFFFAVCFYGGIRVPLVSRFPSSPLLEKKKNARRGRRERQEPRPTHDPLSQAPPNSAGKGVAESQSKKKGKLELFSSGRGRTKTTNEQGFIHHLSLISSPAPDPPQRWMMCNPPKELLWSES